MRGWGGEGRGGACKCSVHVHPAYCVSHRAEGIPRPETRDGVQIADPRTEDPTEARVPF